MHDHHFVHTGYIHGLRTYECTVCGAFTADVEMRRRDDS